MKRQSLRFRLCAYIVIMTILCHDIAYGGGENYNNKLAANSLFEWIEAHSDDRDKGVLAKKILISSKLDDFFRKDETRNYIFRKREFPKLPSDLSGFIDELIPGFFIIPEKSSFQFNDNIAVISVIIDGHPASLTFFKNPSSIDTAIPEIGLEKKDIPIAKARGYWFEKYPIEEKGRKFEPAGAVRLSSPPIVGILTLAFLKNIFFETGSYGYISLILLLVFCAAVILWIAKQFVKEYDKGFQESRRRFLYAGAVLGIACLVSGIFAFRRIGDNQFVELERETTALERKVIEKLKRLAREIEDEQQRKYAVLFVNQFIAKGKLLNTFDGEKAKAAFTMMFDLDNETVTINFPFVCMRSDTDVKGSLIHEGRHIHDILYEEGWKTRAIRVGDAYNFYTKWKQDNSAGTPEEKADDIYSGDRFREVTYKGVTFKPADVIMAKARFDVIGEFRGYQGQYKFYSDELGKRGVRLSEFAGGFNQDDDYSGFNSFLIRSIFELHPDSPNFSVLYRLLECICFDDEEGAREIIRESMKEEEFARRFSLKAFKDYIFRMTIYGSVDLWPDVISDDGSMDEKLFAKSYHHYLSEVMMSIPSRFILHKILTLERARTSLQTTINPNDGLNWLYTGVYNDDYGNEVQIDSIDLSKFSRARDIGGKSADNRTVVNPKLLKWLEKNKEEGVVKVIDYYYYPEEGKWIPHKVEYKENIANGEIELGVKGYYDSNGNPIDKGMKLENEEYQLSDDEQRRLNEVCFGPDSAAYEELGKPVRFRVVLGEMSVAWQDDLEHSSLVHAGVRAGVVWFGEYLFRDLLRSDNDSLRRGVFLHEREHFLAEAEGLDKGDEYKKLVSEVHERCTDIEQRKITNRFINTLKSYKAQKDKRIIFALNTDIGNMMNGPARRLVRELELELNDMENIIFINGKGSELVEKVNDKIRRLGIKRQDVAVVGVTNREIKDFDSVTQVSDSEWDYSGSYIPVLELLTFALKQHFRAYDELKEIYFDIKHEELKDIDIEAIKMGNFVISLPEPKRIPDSFYDRSIELLSAA